MGLRDSFEERFKLNSSEWLETDMKIVEFETKGQNAPEELYEKRWVHWDNIHFLLDEAVRLKLVEDGDEE